MSNSIDLEKLLVLSGKSLRFALQVMDANAQGIVFVVEENRQVAGVLTDGDVRRFLIGGGDLDIVVNEVMITQFVSLPATAEIEDIQKRLSDKIRHIPLLDEKGRVVDCATRTRLRRIPVMEPQLGGNELNYVTACVKTSWISSQGKFVREFEEMLAAFTGMPYALATSNGTVALHLALVALGIGEGDEVIVPDLTFAASINAIIYAGATPVLIDVNKDDWNIDVSKIEKLITPKTKAIMPVHLYGYPAEMDSIMAIAEKHNLLVVEDAAEALGSEWKGKRVGSYGHAATYSFFGNKTITTGEGGMVLFRDQDVYEHAKVLRDHGMAKGKRYWHEYVGFNYRMTNLQAAIGVAQMERVDEILEKKMWLGATYNQAFNNVAGLITPPSSPHAKDTFWLYTLRLEEEANRDDIMGKLMANGIETRPVFFPLHEMPPYQAYNKGSYPNASQISLKGISLPSATTLKQEDINHITSSLNTLLGTKALLEG
ncbi:MAG: aminotransferase class I/II-fold pyridoxal phosphate-dependent enzyme [Bacteroidota bacterium]